MIIFKEPSSRDGLDVNLPMPRNFWELSLGCVRCQPPSAYEFSGIKFGMGFWALTFEDELQLPDTQYSLLVGVL